MTWDFKKNLAESVDESARNMAASCLRQYFGRAPGLVIDFSPGDIPFQQDIDVTAFGERYKVEQKHRPRRDWGDELLEDVSNDQTGRQGWTW